MVLAASPSTGSGGCLTVSQGLAGIRVTLKPNTTPKALFKGLHPISALAGGQAFIVRYFTLLPRRIQAASPDHPGNQGFVLE